MKRSITINCAKLLWAAFATTALVSPASAQGTFQNLDFELATLVPIAGDPYARVQFVPAFPGWRGYVGTNLESAALYNRTFLEILVRTHSTASLERLKKWCWRRR